MEPLSAPERLLAGDGSSRWFKEIHEYRYVEALLVIFFVMVTLVFELSFHKIVHRAAHSYHYGKLQQDQAKAVLAARSGKQVSVHGSQTKHKNAKTDHVKHGKHLQLYKELVNRMGGEFMTLGFLALCIFTFNQSGGFKVMAKYFPPCEDDEAECFHFPTDAYDWLHMMEVVHVKLFLGMLLYFVFMTFLVSDSVKQIGCWEKVNMRMDNIMMLAQNGSASEVEAQLRMFDTDVDEHIMWRDNFIKHILGWQQRRPDLFHEVAYKLKVDVDDPDALARMRERMEGHFSLSSYLALNLEVGVGDSIQVHLPTWFALISTFALLAVLHRTLFVKLTMIVPFILLLFAVFVVCVKLFTKKKLKQMKSWVDQEDHREERETVSGDGTKSVVAARRKVRKKTEHSLEGNVLLGMQVFMFLESYGLSCAIGDVDIWQDDPLQNLLLVLAYALVFLIMAKSTPAVLPNFLAIVSFPPYISDASLAAFFRILFENFEVEGEEHPDPTQTMAMGMELTEELEEDQETLRQSLKSLASEASANDSTAKSEAMIAIEELADILGAQEALHWRLQRRSNQSSDAPAAQQPEESQSQGRASKEGAVAQQLDQPKGQLRSSSASGAGGQLRASSASAAQGPHRASSASAAQGPLRASSASAAQGPLRASSGSTAQVSIRASLASGVPVSDPRLTTFRTMV